MTIGIREIIPNATKSSISGLDLLKIFDLKKRSNITSRMVKINGYASITDEIVSKKGSRVIYNYTKLGDDKFEMTNKTSIPANKNFKFLTSYINGKFRRTSVINKETGASFAFEKKNGHIVEKNDYI